jgi:hypothetical protein
VPSKLTIFSNFKRNGGAASVNTDLFRNLAPSAESMHAHARHLLMTRQLSLAAQLAEWLDTRSPDRMEGEKLEILARSKMAVRDTAGLLRLLQRHDTATLNLWFLNDAAIYLQHEGEYVAAIDLLMNQKAGPNWDGLLEIRLTELTQCKESESFIPYFRRAEFIPHQRADGLMIDEPWYTAYCNVDKFISINGEAGDFRWPRRLKCVRSSEIQLEDVIVLSDCSVLTPDVLLYESVKAVQHSWRFTHPRCNDFFGQYTALDPWIQLTSTPRIDAEIPHAFLVPNPIEGVGHFIHDALPVVDSFWRYCAQAHEPTIVLRRLRPFDRQAILDLITRFFGNVRVLQIEPGSGVKVKRLFATTSPFSPSQDAVCAEAIASVNSRARVHYASASTAQRRIYIARDDGQNIDARAVIDSLIVGSGLLERAGFEKVTLSKLGLGAQMEIFAGASHIAGVHGAGLMNIAFAPLGLAVTEFVVPHAANYYTIAMFSASLGYDYRAVDASRCITQDNARLSTEGIRLIEDALMRSIR